MASIVVIEDDQHIRASIAQLLAGSGHDVVTSGTAMAGLEKAVHEAPDLVLLDLGLPDVDGTELLKMIRAVSKVPVIVITARGDDQVVVATLDSGADDYLIKPFTTSQLAARVRAVLRRAGADTERERISVGGLDIDIPARSALLDGAALDLSPKEFDLLVCLARRAGEVLTKRDLLAEVWREPYGGSERTVDVHLSWLRKKLGETAADPRYLQTVFGVGVKLVDPST
ncbi:MAG: response regulator transcription factor [Actinobacteria bacterium]|nr:response regulator transcription factor [Actinomycetota bacterium]MBU1493171.1 response regulator transcription factor [Actinomycetota bacterium]